MVKAVFLLFALAITIAHIDCGKMSEEEAKEAMGALAKKCAEESGATEDDVASIQKREVPESKTGKCFVGCFYREMGVIRDGKYSAQGLEEASMNMYEPGSPELEKIKNIGQTCEEKVGGEADECELGAKAMECEVPLVKAAGLN